MPSSFICPIPGTVRTDSLIFPGRKVACLGLLLSCEQKEEAGREGMSPVSPSLLFDRKSWCRLSGCRAQGDLESIPSLPVASLDMASGSSQVSVKEPIVGKSHKY